jgi:hypothetical protein
LASVRNDVLRGQLLQLLKMEAACPRETLVSLAIAREKPLVTHHLYMTHVTLNDACVVYDSCYLSRFFPSMTWWDYLCARHFYDANFHYRLVLSYLLFLETHV